MSANTETDERTRDSPWIAALPDRQRTAVKQMMPLFAILTREADEVTAGNLIIRMVETQFAAARRSRPKSNQTLALLRGRVAREEIKRQEGGSISAAEAAERLGISKTAVLKRHREGKLLGWREARQDAVRMPVWQFTEDDVLPGLAKVLQVLTQATWLDDWARILFFLNRRTSLGGNRPLDLLRQGKTRPVLDAAMAAVE